MRSVVSSTSRFEKRTRTMKTLQWAIARRSSAYGSPARVWRKRHVLSGATAWVDSPDGISIGRQRLHVGRLGRCGRSGRPDAVGLGGSASFAEQHAASARRARGAGTEEERGSEETRGGSGQRRKRSLPRSRRPRKAPTRSSTKATSANGKTATTSTSAALSTAAGRAIPIIRLTGSTGRSATTIAPMNSI